MNAPLLSLKLKSACYSSRRTGGTAASDSPRKHMRARTQVCPARLSWHRALEHMKPHPLQYNSTIQSNGHTPLSASNHFQSGEELLQLTQGWIFSFRSQRRSHYRENRHPHLRESSRTKATRTALPS